jgi:hypothetical protein
MLVSTYKITWYHNPEDCDLVTHSHKELKTKVSYKYYATNITLSYFNRLLIASHYIIKSMMTSPINAKLSSIPSLSFLYMT